MSAGKRKVNLSDVARAAGVSRGAAGKVLNGCSGAIRVSEETRKRIVEAAAKLGYTRNMAAAMLAGKKSPLVGVMLDSQSGFRRLQLLTELEAAATKRNLRLLVSYTHDNIAQMRQNRSEMESFGVRGIICLSHDYYAYKKEVTELFAGNCGNVVFMEEPFFPGAAYIRTSDEKAHVELFAAMKKAGKRRIALIRSGLESYSERERERCFRNALEVNGLELFPGFIRELSVQRVFTDEAEEALKGLFSASGPDAVFADDAVLHLALRRSLLEAPRKIQKNVLFYGGNGNPMFKLLLPPAGSFDPRYNAAAEALLDALEDLGTPGCRAVIESKFTSLYP